MGFGGGLINRSLYASNHSLWKVVDNRPRVEFMLILHLSPTTRFIHIWTGLFFGHIVCPLYIFNREENQDFISKFLIYQGFFAIPFSIQGQKSTYNFTLTDPFL